jgi:hypothetical protein
MRAVPASPPRVETRHTGHLTCFACRTSRPSPSAAEGAIGSGANAVGRWRASSCAARSKCSPRRVLRAFAARAEGKLLAQRSASAWPRWNRRPPDCRAGQLVRGD